MKTGIKLATMLAAAMGAAGAAQAQTVFWTNAINTTAATNWSNSGSWSNSAPASGGGQDYMIVLLTPGANTTNYNDWGSVGNNGFLLNSLVMSNQATGYDVIGGSNLVFISNTGGATPTLNAGTLGNYNWTINNNIVLSNSLTITGGNSIGSSSTRTLNGIISGVGDITNSSLNGKAMTLANAVNTFTGNWVLNGGGFQFVSADTCFGSASNGVVLQNGGTLQLNNNLTWSGARVLTIGPGDGILSEQAGGRTLTMTNTTSLAGSGRLVLGTSGNVALNTNQPNFSGSVLVGGGVTASATLTLGASNALGNATGIVATNYGIVVLGNPYAAGTLTITNQANSHTFLNATPAAGGGTRLSLGDLAGVGGSDARLNALTNGVNLGVSGVPLVIHADVAGTGAPAGLDPSNLVYGLGANMAYSPGSIGDGAPGQWRGLGVGVGSAYGIGTNASYGAIVLNGNAELDALAGGTLTITNPVAGGAADKTLAIRGGGTVVLLNADNNIASLIGGNTAGPGGVSTLKAGHAAGTMSWNLAPGGSHTNVLYVNGTNGTLQINMPDGSNTFNRMTQGSTAGGVLILNGTANSTNTGLALAGAQAIQNVDGGIVQIAGGTWNVPNLGQNNTGSQTRGTNYISNATLNVTASGRYTAGSFYIQSNGVVNILGDRLALGTEQALTTPVFFMDVANGGTLFVTNTIATSLGGGAANETACINQTGGLVVPGASLTLGTGTQAAQTNYYNLGGGVLRPSGNITAAAYGKETFNFNGGTLQAGANITLGGGNLTGVVQSAGAILDSSNYAVTVTAPLTDGGGGGGLTKLGSGTLLLNATNTFAGGATIRSGALLLGAGAYSNLASTAGLTVEAGGAIGTNGALTQGFLDDWLSGRVAAGGTAVTGAVAMAAGTAAPLAFTNTALANAFLGAAGAAATMSAAASWADSTVRLGGGNSNLTYAPALGGGTSLFIGPIGGNALSTVILTNAANSYAGGTLIQSGTLQLGSGGAATNTLLGNTSGVTNNGILAVNFGSGAGAFANVAITGPGALDKLGAGTAIVTNANTYTGPTIISAGILQIGAGGNLGNGGNATNSATLLFSRPDSFSLNNRIAGSGTNIVTGGGTLNFTGGGGFNNNGMLMLGGTTGAGNFNAGVGGQTLGSLWVASTNASLTNTVFIGAGQTLGVLGGGNSLVVGVSGTNAFANLAVSGAGALVVSNSGASVLIGGTNLNVTTVDLSRLGTFTASLGTTGTFRVGTSFANNTGPSSATLTLATNSTIVAGTLKLDVAGTQGGTALSLLLLGSGTTTLDVNTINVHSGAGLRNNYGQIAFATNTGVVIVRAADGVGPAALNIGSARVLPTGTNSVDFAGHFADLLFSTVTVADASTADTQGGPMPNSFTFDTGTLTAQNFKIATQEAAGNPGGTLFGVVNLGGGTVAISGGVTLANNLRGAATNTTLSGVLNISGGDVTIGADAATNSLYLAAGAGTAAAAVNLTGGTVTLNGNIAKGGGTGLNTASLTLSNATLNLTGHAIGDGANPLNAVNLQAGVLQNLGEFNGGAPLVKTSAGTLTLSGTNTYSGSTVVSNGTLQLGASGSIGNSPLLHLVSTTSTADVSAVSSFHLANGQQLKGVGTVQGGLIMDPGAQLNPGNSAGTLNVSGDLTLAGGTTNYFDLVGPNSSDLVEVGGTLNLGGIQFTDFVWNPDAGVGTNEQTYTLFHSGGAVAGSLGTVTNGLVNGNTAYLHTGGAGNDELQLTVIPEPGTVGMLGLWAAAVLWRRRLRG